jgi:hypothetical protein
VAVSTDTVFTSVAQCAEATGIPVDVLKYATRHPDAVNDLNGAKYSHRIKWQLLKPWLEDHEQEIEEITQEDYEKWRTLKTKAQAELAQIELEEKRGRIVEKQRVHDLLKSISAAQCSLFNSKFRQELPPKLLGKDVPTMQVLIDDALSEVFAILHKPLSQWK